MDESEEKLSLWVDWLLKIQSIFWTLLHIVKGKKENCSSPPENWAHTMTEELSLHIKTAAIKYHRPSDSQRAQT